jgi:predicted nuclease of predicted toxin-antitoxin system
MARRRTRGAGRKSVKILVDMNLSPLWAEYLSRHGFEAVHWPRVVDQRASDPEFLAWARENGFVVFSHDLDFSRLLAKAYLP